MAKRPDRAVYIPEEHTWEYVLDDIMMSRYDSELHLIHQCGFTPVMALDFLESLRADLLSM